MKFNFFKFKKEKKNDNKLRDVEDLLKKIEEDEREIEKYRENLILANEKIKKLEQELNKIKCNVAEEFNESKDNYDVNENNKEIETLTLGKNNEDYDPYEDINLNNSLEDTNIELSSIKEGNFNIISDDKKEIEINLNEEISKEKVEDSHLNDEFIDKEIIDESESDNIEVLDNKCEEDILSRLKEYYLTNNEDEVKNILVRILNNIKSLENNFIDNDMVFLIYISYFYDLLEVLLVESNKINEFYLSKSKEMILLSIINEERNCEIYGNINECTQNYMKINRDLFEDFTEEIKTKLFEDIKKLTYKAFNFVYKVNNIEYGVDTYNITALARDDDNSTWKLVEGLVSTNGYEFYLLQTVISILNLRTIDIAKLPNKDNEEVS